jgi:hypothetical protein
MLYCITIYGDLSFLENIYINPIYPVTVIVGHTENVSNILSYILRSTFLMAEVRQEHVHPACPLLGGFRFSMSLDALLIMLAFILLSNSMTSGPGLDPRSNRGRFSEPRVS